jgi:anti-sigma regulatory factor (Ser/Thr protein kinase)
VQSATGPHRPPGMHGTTHAPTAASGPAPQAPGSLTLLPGTPPATGAPAPRIYLEVEADPAMVPQVRRFTRSTLDRWELSDAANDTELIISELLTNAITATARMKSSARIGLLMTADPGQLLLLVWDASPEPPVRQDHDHDAPAGRGLQIIEALGARWGSCADSHGKVVWAALGCR